MIDCSTKPQSSPSVRKHVVYVVYRVCIECINCTILDVVRAVIRVDIDATTDISSSVVRLQ